MTQRWTDTADAELVRAASDADIDAIDRLLAEGSVPNGVVTMQFPMELHGRQVMAAAPVTPLGVAIRSSTGGGREAVAVERLLSAGALPLANSVGPQQLPALGFSLLLNGPRSSPRRAYDCARVLIAAGVAVEEADDENTTLLSNAAHEGATLATRLLLNARADPNRAKRNGSTPAYRAAQEGHAPAGFASLQATAAAGFAKGARVSVHGLQSRQELNGAVGRVLEVDMSKGRLNVQLRDGSVIALKGSNLQEAPPAEEQQAEGQGSVPVSREEVVEALQTVNPRTLRWLLSRGDIDPDMPVPTHLVPNATSLGQTACLLSIASLFSFGGAQGEDADNSAENAMMWDGVGPALLEALLDSGATVDGRGGAEKTPLMVAAKNGNPGYVRLLLERGASVSLRWHETGGDALMMTGMCKHDARGAACAQILLDAKADVEGVDGAGYTPLLAAAEWGRSEIVAKLIAARAELDRSPSKDNGPGDLLVSVVSNSDEAHTSDADALRAALDAGEASEEDLIDELRDMMRIAQAFQADEVCDVARMALEALCKAEEVALHPPEDALLPRGSVPVLGGRVRLQGLTSEGAPNGKLGRVLSYNNDGRRRFGVQVEGRRGALSLRPQNLVAVDIDPLPLCEHEPGTFVERLQAELKEAGLPSYEVVDWTRLAETTADPMHLMETAVLGHAFSRHKLTLFYVQRTPRNEGFFVAEREYYGRDRGGNAAAMPWLVFSGRRHGSPDGPVGGTLIPPQGRRCSTIPFMLRLVRTILSPRVECTVCLAPQDLMGSSQLPCVHLLCSDCAKKLYPLERPGLTCPTCKEHFPRHALISLEGRNFGGNTLMTSDVAFAEV
ncbi:hypothetical protein EMIHUDRAFT_95474 [Emiliania huxleyi CCMP1516]|uniref:RING-type domain-containing protein n=2 Tax=Emiliania huxleyi TaxID=2903 RepID=A0A0D3JH73_EMIH1|nr:hypothetical protein EMIHUDRAFT_95474 [Emiliania huxleyi CCMP1516]EOD22858.1 hypothetical protein EMIHUDRAFT_95474 [Emiliania huxleyi CCMP1516]|eukprot:XP_005775287.1 hypothetical protein EMIHUDRAFT_95474 [Emiliania huxleyi CCMP1516]